MFLGVPKGSILVPVLFNHYVAELENRMSSTSIQYAANTAIYRHCKNWELYTCFDKIEQDVGQLSSWSFNSDLTIFN